MDLLLSWVTQGGCVGQNHCSLAWGLLLFYFWKGTETHLTKDSRAAKEKLRNTRNEGTCKLGSSSSLSVGIIIYF